MARNVCKFLVFISIASIAFIGGCADSNLKKARQHQKEGDYNQAAHYYRLALDKDPENKSVRYSLVEALSQELMKTPKDQLTTDIVEETMQELLPIAQPLMDDPNIKRYVSLIYQLLAQRYADQGMDDKAADTWGKVVNIDPSFTEGHYNLGVALSKEGKVEEAIPHFEKSIDLNPYFLDGYFAMGNSYVALGRYEDATKYYLKALEINPDDPEVRQNLGIAYSNVGKTEEAIGELEKAIELQPGYFLAYRSLSTLYKGLGETEKVAEIDKKWEEYAKEHLKETEQPEQTEEAENNG